MTEIEQCAAKLLIFAALRHAVTLSFDPWPWIFAVNGGLRDKPLYKIFSEIEQFSDELLTI